MSQILSLDLRTQSHNSWLVAHNLTDFVFPSLNMTNFYLPVGYVLLALSTTSFLPLGLSIPRPCCTHAQTHWLLITNATHLDSDWLRRICPLWIQRYSLQVCESTSSNPGRRIPNSGHMLVLLLKLRPIYFQSYWDPGLSIELHWSSNPLWTSLLLWPWNLPSKIWFTCCLASNPGGWCGAPGTLLCFGHTASRLVAILESHGPLFNLTFHLLGLYQCGPGPAEGQSLSRSDFSRAGGGRLTCSEPCREERRKKTKTKDIGFYPLYLSPVISFSLPLLSSLLPPSQPSNLPSLNKHRMLTIHFARMC